MKANEENKDNVTKRPVMPLRKDLDFSSESHKTESKKIPEDHKKTFKKLAGM